MTPTLLALDWLLAAGGVVMLVSHLARRSSHPHSFLRPHHFREDAIFFVVLAYVLTALALDALVRRWIADPNDPRFRMIVGSGSQLAGAVACAVVASKRFTGGVSGFLFGPSSTSGIRKFTVIVGVALVGIGVCPLIAEGTARVVHFFAPNVVIEAHPTLQALRSDAGPVWLTIGLWTGAAIIAPVAEEFFFRGMLQNVLAAILPQRSAAILLASLAFGAVHLSNAHTVPALVVLGLLLGYAYERSGSILVPVTIHTLFNLKSLVWEALAAGAGARAV